MESERKKFEILKRFIETIDENELLECLKVLEEQAVTIGYGKNAEVLALENYGTLSNLCAKKMKAMPFMKCNAPEVEFEFQQHVRDLGIKTPLLLAIVRDLDTRQDYLIMERIHGVSLGNILHDGKPIPENYDHEVFFEKLKQDIEKMHKDNIHHRDLHSGNVMIDENGDPVMIDWGTATRALSGDEFPYKEEVLLLNEQTNRYNLASGYLKSDESGLGGLRSEMNRVLTS